MNQIRISRLEDIKGKFRSSQKGEQCNIFKLKKIINHIYNVIIVKKYGYYQSEGRVRRSMRGIFKQILQKVKVKIRKPCY